MALVITLNNGQAIAINKQAYHQGITFNVILDGDGENVISQQEVDQCDDIPQFNFIKTRPLIEFVPPISTAP